MATAHILRPATAGDLPALYQMAKSTGGGFTNLPPDRAVLAARLERAAAALARGGDTVGDDLFFFVLEEAGAERRISGTCQIFTRIGATAPFYSFRRDSVVRHSPALGRSFTTETLTLTDDLTGCSEVGGLYLLAGERSAGIGALLARSRYLFIAAHRSRFGDRTLAELRGVHDEAGGSPFWDGVAGRFFGMTFHEADAFNARHGTGPIAALMPRHPLHLALLSDGALAAVGVPHQSGRAAMRMLEAEGFVHDHYLDLFDGGPTMTVATDAIATIRAARQSAIVATRPMAAGATAILAHGRLAGFRATLAAIGEGGDGIVVDPATAARLGAGLGDVVTHVPR